MSHLVQSGVYVELLTTVPLCVKYEHYCVTLNLGSTLSYVHQPDGSPLSLYCHESEMLEP